MTGAAVPQAPTARAVKIDEPLHLAGGQRLTGYTLSYETYGRLSAERDNAILVCHSLTKDAHAASVGDDSGRGPGWWDAAIGPGKMLDTDRYFVISSDALGAGGSTGPASINPATGKPYGLGFPVVTVRDMVIAQRHLVECLGIDCLHAVIGGCLGGQQAIQWAISHSGAVRNAIVIATTPATSAHTIAIFAVLRRLIRSDPAWNGGDYYTGSPPLRGLGNAVAAGVPLWMSRGAMEARFGHPPRSAPERAYSLDPEFEVETFIEQIAERARTETDANSFMYLMRAVEYFDLEREYGSLEDALAGVTARILFISYDGDWRYPAGETERLHRVLRAAGRQSSHLTLGSPLGHGAFLYDVAGLVRVVDRFLAGARSPGIPAARSPGKLAMADDL